MAIYIYEQFLRDLRNEGDSKFPRRVLSKVIDGQCKFVPDREDHRYEDIPGAWIRYVSIGAIGIRVIFIRKGADIYLYRAGPHSVEDNLTQPQADATVIPVVPTPADLSLPAETEVRKRFLENYRPEYIRTKLLSRRFAKHRSVILISPYISPELFLLSSPFGKVLNDLRDEGAKVSLITRSPTTLEELRFFEHLEAQGMDILFHETVHAKLFLFELDEEYRYGQATKIESKLGLIGSANLTALGLAIGGTSDPVAGAYEELLYELPADEFSVALDYATYLTLSASDIPRQRVVLTKRARRSTL